MCGMARPRTSPLFPAMMISIVGLSFVMIPYSWLVGVEWWKGAGLAFPTASAMTTNAGVVLSRESTVAIPIFPLQKRVLLPSEELILNLYEDRYLALAERFLQPPPPRTTTATATTASSTTAVTSTTPPMRPLSTHHGNGCPSLTTRFIMGAVPSTEKPHLLSKGFGPMVPILEPGDVGVVCVVTHAFESLQIPTTMTDGTLTTRRRIIRLHCTAWCRMEITEICSRGTTPTTTTTTAPFGVDDRLHRADPSCLPYITAKVRWLVGTAPPPPLASSSSRADRDDSKQQRRRDWKSLFQNTISSSSSSSLEGGCLSDEFFCLANNAILRQLDDFCEYLHRQSLSSSQLSQQDRMRLLRNGLFSGQPSS
jgi:hypothetical protein